MQEASRGPSAEEILVDAARALGESLSEVATRVQKRLTEDIAPLRGEAALMDLLGASIESNLEMFAQMVRYEVSPDEVQTPPPAAEYARRLAQRGTDPSALLRAYRLGQETALLWTLDHVASSRASREVAMAASRGLVSAAFRYVDAVSAQVITEYDAERARWLANNNSVRLATLGDLLRGQVVDVSGAEAALGYRLRQHHVGVLLWLDREGSPTDLRALEHLLNRIGKQAGARGQSLFVPQDRSTAWGWLPFGRQTHRAPTLDKDLLAELENLGARVALGSAAAGPDGFRSTHEEAARAQELAQISGQGRVTSFGDPDVRAATFLMGDLDATRRLVAHALGELAADDGAAARLRDTVRTFLATGGSYQETAERMSMHRNTVRYRLERAVESRGRSLDEDRLDLELALIACEWLGSNVLP